MEEYACKVNGRVSHNVNITELVVYYGHHPVFLNLKSGIIATSSFVSHQKLNSVSYFLWVISVVVIIGWYLSEPFIIVYKTINIKQLSLQSYFNLDWIYILMWDNRQEIHS